MNAMQLSSACDVEALNDGFARRHDIDAYYARANPIVRWIENRRLHWIRDAAKIQPGDSLLEVGCGGGHVLQMFPQAKLTGVDVSSVMLEKARRNLGIIPARLLHGELAELNLESESFDAVICTEVLEHVVDPAALLSQMKRLLRPDGRAVITFPNDALINGAKAMIRATGLSALPFFRNINWGGDEYHLHQWSLNEMRKLLESNFRIERFSGVPGRLMPVRRCFLCRHAG